MKRVVVFIGLFFVSVFLYGQSQASPAENSSHWQGATHIEELDTTLTEKESYLPPDCELKPTNIVKYDIKRSDEAMDLFASRSYENAGEYCHVINGAGKFATMYTDAFSAPRRETRYYTDFGYYGNLGIASGTTGWLDPAPTGSNVAHLSRPDGYTSYYDISIEKNFSSWGKKIIDQYTQKWVVDSSRYNSRNSFKFTYADGTEVEAQKHVFSRNGRYFLWGDNSHMGVVDLATRRYTPVVGRQNHPVRIGNFAVSNDGRYVATVNSNNVLTIYSTRGCHASYGEGEWQKLGTLNESFPGCIVVWQNQRTSYSEDFWHSSRSIRRLYFSQNGDSLYFLRQGEKAEGWTPNRPKYTWNEYRLVADDYTSSVQGYLAMGDSYSSGEGDNEGGEWYEPGTDEQGDRDTFLGRNLCHLSRRSYPYLIALELGYLGFNDRSPPSGGLFHSVACSGAKIHNISGLIGEKQDEGPAYEFAETDNQYIRIDDLELGVWQPGFTKQISAYTGETLINDLSRNFSPEVITLGIGGNDAGFGGFLLACAKPGDCEHSQNNSAKAVQTARIMAAQKNRLATLYKRVRHENPDSRIYVHGYPVFVRGSGGYCAVNVRLSDQERNTAEGAVRYMNEVVRAAAREAGVFYVDVTDILNGGRLCDPVNDNQMFVNGATAGNDNPLKLLGNICIRNCIGNESYHPNPKGFARYKDAIISQTNGFNAPMPEPDTDVAVPLPPNDLFGAKGALEVAKLNTSSVNEQVSYSVTELIQQTDDRRALTISQSGLYPGTPVVVEVHSEPQVIAGGTVSTDGIFSSQFELPDLTPGYHEIHLIGIDAKGQKVDRFQSILVGQSDVDFDGDGILNADDQCVIFSNSGIDSDEDGLDDVCDGYFDLARQKDAMNNLQNESSTQNTKASDSYTLSYSNEGTPTQFISNETATFTNNPRAESVFSAKATPLNIDSSEQGRSSTDKAVFLWIFAATVTIIVAIMVYTMNRRKHEH